MAILILDNYDSFTYNLYQMVQALTDETVVVHENNALSFSDIRLMAPKAIILSPGPGHPKNASDVGICAEVLNDYEKLPNQPAVFGVCLGHQLMVYHCGGQIGSAPSIQHGKTSMLKMIADHPLFKGLSTDCQIMRYHSLAAELPLPSSVECLAVDGHDGSVMAIAHHQYPWLGIQFHPESVGTPEGGTLLDNFLQMAGIKKGATLK